MRLGILGDLQLTSRAPERRLDNYSETQMNKLGQIFTIFDDKSCDCIVQPGDFFDSPTVANKVKAATIRFLRERFRSGKERNNKDWERVFCVYGQHDISGHSISTLPNSPLAVLEAAGVAEVLSSEKEPAIVGTVNEDSDVCVALYGSSFGEPVPEPYEDCYNILVTHRMIGDRPLWPSQELVGPRQFLRKYPDFNLIICGDYHYRFVEKWNGRTIVNVGALVRKTISKFDLEHKPAVGVFDTLDDSLEIFELDVKPVEKVFNLTRKPEKRDSKILAELVERIKKSGKKLSGWKHILVKVLKEKESSQGVKEVIDQTLEEIKNG